MKFSGTLIESLMATVQRAELRVESNRVLVVEPLAIDSWFASGQESAEYDSQFFGVA